MLLLVLALLWVAILIPIAVRYLRDGGTERSIESFYAEREMLSRQEHVVAPEQHFERPAPLAHEPERGRRPHLTVVHPDDTVGSLQARGTWDDWSRNYDYEDDVDRARHHQEKNRYAAAYATVPGDGFRASYDAPYQDRVSMRVRRRRICVTLLVLCMVLTALTFVSKSPMLENVAVVAWDALLGFVVLALVSLGLGYMGTSSATEEYEEFPAYEPVVAPALRDFVYDDFIKVADEREWRRETGRQRALG